MTASSEDEIAVSPAMVEAGADVLFCYAEVGAEAFFTTGDIVAIYRAMERVRRAEADAEVIRRSVLPS